jgi:glycosyltransferase involved in cell wall biosynthesis
MSVVAGAEASVLPSQVDNLPNTVIESLSYGVPVVGTYDSSVDEIVEDSVTGRLVKFGDTKALANAMVELWLGRSAAEKGFVWEGTINKDMQPDIALRNFLALGA